MPQRVIPADINETPNKNELPQPHALRLAVEKAHAVHSQNNDAIVLAADTVVACGRRILPKAETSEQVAECLRLLQGRRHNVYTGHCVIAPNGKVKAKVSSSVVKFDRMTEQDITQYVASGDGLGKAGGYAIQGLASVHISFISGSYSNIMGLDVHLVKKMLKGL